MMRNRKKTSKPEDNSDEFAKIGVEMQRLGWTIEDGRNYLFQTYGKKSRHVLSREELLDFLHYLQSQPISANNNAIAKQATCHLPLRSKDTLVSRIPRGFDEIEKEIERLYWSEDEQQQYLLQTYGKESLKLLTQEEFDKLIIYLKSQPSAVINTFKDEDFRDFRDLLNDTNLKMLLLDWTKEQRRDYLIKTYGKKSLYFLTGAELLDFNSYLDSRS
jgi:replicative superfamily II helicase